jgi:hypothetical protein
MLWKGRIYKCSTSALTKEAWTTHGSPNADAWMEYFDDTTNGSIGLDSNVEEFVENFGKPHSVCQQCPTKLDDESFIKHRIKVVKR